MTLHPLPVRELKLNISVSQTTYLLFLVGVVTLKAGTDTQVINLVAGDKVGVKINNILTEMDHEFVFE